MAVLLTATGLRMWAMVAACSVAINCSTIGSAAAMALRAVRSQIGNAREIVTIPKALAFPHPRDAGARLTTTWPVGQLADFVLEFEIGATPLLIREFSDRYQAFVAGVQLTQQVIRMVEANPAAALYGVTSRQGPLRTLRRRDR